MRGVHQDSDCQASFLETSCHNPQEILGTEESEFCIPGHSELIWSCINDSCCAQGFCLAQLNFRVASKRLTLSDCQLGKGVFSLLVYLRRTILDPALHDRRAKLIQWEYTLAIPDGHVFSKSKRCASGHWPSQREQQCRQADIQFQPSLRLAACDTPMSLGEIQRALRKSSKLRWIVQKAFIAGQGGTREEISNATTQERKRAIGTKQST